MGAATSPISLWCPGPLSVNRSFDLAGVSAESMPIARDPAVTEIFDLPQTRNCIENARRSIQQVPRTGQSGHHAIDGIRGATCADDCAIAGNFHQKRGVSAILFADPRALT